MPTVFVVRRLRPVNPSARRREKAVHDATGTMLMIYEPTREDGKNYTNKKPGPYVRPGFT